jgi:NADH-quinone oxidoreductase subunit C
MAEEQTPHPAPPAAAKPTGRSADEIRHDALVASAVEQVSESILDAKEFAGEITLIVDRDDMVSVAKTFKADGFNYLVDLAGVDYSTYPGYKGDRFGVSYTLYSFAKNKRVRLRTYTDAQTPIPSVTGVWKTANWQEREAYDMFGIEFSNHPNLERILMWEGFNGHPLRKDFPIRGIDTGARIYPEVFPVGGGPKAGSTGKDPKDVNIYEGPWMRRGFGVPAGMSEKTQMPPAPELAGTIADTAKPTQEAPWHDPDLAIEQRLDLAKAGDLKAKLFAAMAQTDCTACGWDCEGYAAALAAGETKDISLCVPGEKETESTLQKLMKDAGKM